MKRGVAVALAAGVAIVLVGGAAAVWVTNRPPGIEAAAQQYLDALGAGDWEAIDAMRAHPLDDESEEVLESAFTEARSYATDGKVLVISDDGAVRARAVIAGADVTIGFVLARVGDRWHLDSDYLVPVSVTSPIGDSAWIGGAQVNVDTDVFLLPAAYDVAPAPRGLLDGSTGIVVADESVAVELPAVLSADAAALAQEQLDRYADGCAAPAETVPDFCGLRVPWAADLTALERLSFRIDAYPAVELDVERGTFQATDGAIVATAVGEARNGSAGTFTYRTDDWSLYGELSLTGEDMRLSVR